MIETQKASAPGHTSAFLERMMEEIEDYAIIFLNTQGIITQWNRGAQKIKGYASSEAIGKSFEMFYPAEDKADGLPQKLLREAFEKGKAIHEGWRVRKDGSLFWGSVLITALHDEQRNVIGFAKLTRDLTERKLAEDTLRKKNKELERTNQELSSFAYIASHDLQEPLRKIQTFISRISELEKENLSEKSRDYFKRIENAGERMQQLIDDLLSYSRTRPDETKVEPVNLNIILQEVTKSLSQSVEEKNATIDIGTLPTVRGIRFQLQQIFSNLLSNALKFSKPDIAPKITVTSSEEHPTGNRGAVHHIIVSDNGIGFEKEYSEKIFELFQRLHGRSEYPGTGIGLAIVKKIMENHNGTVYAQSEPGEGSSFHLLFPVME